MSQTLILCAIVGYKQCIVVNYTRISRNL